MHRRSLLVLLALLFATPCFATVGLYVNASIGGVVVNPGESGTFAIYATNYSGDEAADATLTIAVPEPLVVTEVVSPWWQCSAATPSITCTRHFAAHEDLAYVTLTVRAPSSPDGGNFTVHASLASVPPSSVPHATVDVFVVVNRTFTVTNDGDDGAGTLRDAILQANARCDKSVPCRMTFAAPMTIEPRTPLPTVTAFQLAIDGGWTTYGALETRAVEISGAKCSFANGLEVDSAGNVTLTGLAVNGFAANGIAIRGGVVHVRACSVGTNAEGTKAKANGLRGISVEGAKSDVTVEYSIISGNTRSGIAIWDANTVNLSSNHIGVGRNYEWLSNGASGIFTNGGLMISQRDFIAANHEFGVAVGSGAKLAGVNSTVILNGGLPVDYGLDGPTASDPTGRMPPTPVLYSATYDPAQDVTLVYFSYPLVGVVSNVVYSVHFYRGTTDENGQTELFPLRIEPPGITPVAGIQTATFKGDLRGQTIFGVTQVRQFPDSYFFSTSEYSAGLAIP